MKTEKFVNVQREIEAVQVTLDNLKDVAVWSGGELMSTDKGLPFIKVPVLKPYSERQTTAFVGDFVTFANNGFKVYAEKAFKNSFTLPVLVEEKSVV